MTHLHDDNVFPTKMPVELSKLNELREKSAAIDWLYEYAGRHDCWFDGHPARYGRFRITMNAADQMDTVTYTADSFVEAVEGIKEMLGVSEE